MNDILRAELRKLRYTRSLWAIPAAGVLISVLAATVLVTSFKATEIASRLSDHGPLRFGATNLGLLLLLFGVRAFADETHHQTLPSTFVSTPARRAVLAGKAMVAAAVALATCVVIYAAVLVVTVLAVERRDLEMTFDVAETAALFGRVTFAMVLLTLLGVGVAAAIRNRTVALIGCALWLALGENLVGSLFRIPKLVPGAVVRGVVSGTSPDSLSAAPAAALLTAFVVVAFAAASSSLHRDVT
jgi:hypothetical protein